MFRLSALFAALLALTAVGGGSPTNQPAIVLEGWGAITDPDGDCSFKVKGDTVTVTVPGTPHDYAAELGRLNAPRLLSAVRGDFVAELRVGGEFRPTPDPTEPRRRPYVGAGLLLTRDAANSVSLHRGCVFLDGKPRHYANFETRVGGKQTLSRYELEIPNRDAYLRLERRGGMLTASVSTDRREWQSYPAIKTDLPADAQLGAVVVNNSTRPFRCTLSELSVLVKR